MTLIRECAVIVPVYNEASAVIPTVLSIQGTLRNLEGSFEIICVDDGSTDGTPNQLKTLSNVTVITHPVNRGYGAALRTGIEATQKEWIVIVDADGTYPIDALPHLFREMRDGIEMVVGSREGSGISSAPFRRLARWILRKMVHVLTGYMVPDLNSGMRVFRKKLYKEFNRILPFGFSFTTTLTVASLYSGYRIKFVPVDYSKRVGTSNIRPLQDFLGFVILIVRLASYFEPLRFFIPLSGALLGIAVLRTIRDILVANAIGSLAVLLAIGALQVFITGILADVIVRRSGLGEAHPMRSTETRSNASQATQRQPQKQEVYESQL